MQGTRLLINATSVISGKRVVFSRESDTGFAAQIEKSNPNSLKLARVVAASACVPGLFKPLRIGNDMLVDGGVVDNQGIETLLDYFAITSPKRNALPVAMRQPDSVAEKGKSIFLIISDGAGQFTEKEGSKSTRVGTASRSMEILQSENRRKTLTMLLAAKKSGHLSGFAFTHLAQNNKGKKNVERLPTEFIVPAAEIRTDLDDFARLERDVLIYHGYTLMTENSGSMVRRRNRPRLLPPRQRRAGSTRSSRGHRPSSNWSIRPTSRGPSHRVARSSVS